MKVNSLHPPKTVLAWLVIVYLMILAMVAVGGITRLTGSGLSMTEWHPLMGWLPPLSEADWNAVYELYKKSPQYLEVNSWMQLEDFKQIFFWEYIHRLLGRSIGSVFFLPWLFFVLRGSVHGAWAWRTFLAFVLGGAQGLLGWFMVRSGLHDIPEVSHYRLAAHLSLAFFVGVYVLWLAMDIYWPQLQRSAHTLRKWAWAFVGMLAIQVVYGAFMAGKKAGLLYPSFPDFFGEWFPAAAWTLTPTWLNFLANPSMIHAIHRWLGWGVALAGLALAVAVWRGEPSPRQRRLAIAIAAAVVAQLGLGALTVLWSVPLWTAVAHQVMGYLLVSLAVALVHALGVGSVRHHRLALSGGTG
jgi:cytochrome c oxidase assembly protein subunit 15